MSGHDNLNSRDRPTRREALTRALAAFLKRYEVEDELLIVGVSGGPDSLALLHALAALRNEFRLRLHAAHLNHQLRDGESEADARFVEAQTQAWGIPVTVESHDVLAYARVHKLSTEEAARLVRYGFLAQVAEREGAQDVAVAHNADDQVETILMHFLRGAGPAGLRGMQPSTRYPLHPPLRLLRPFLEVYRADTEAYCQEHGLAPRTDSTNVYPTMLRNRLRHQLLPLLKTYNPNLDQALRRSARVVSDDYAYLSQRAEGAWRRIILQETPDAVEFSLGGWRQLQPALKRMQVRMAVMRLRPTLRNLSAEHVDHAVYVADHDQTGKRATLPEGLFLLRLSDSILITAQVALSPLPHAPKQPVTVVLPGRTVVDGRWLLESRILARAELPADALLGIDPLECFLDADKAGETLIIRTRRAGDFFRPLGLAGKSKPLRRFMIDTRVPAAWRAHTPLLVADDEILWVAGWRIAETAKIGPTTKKVISLRFVQTE